MYASQYWRFEQPRHWINSGGLGTMGFAVPAAMGAKVGQPDKRVVAIDGDGCFQMTAQELATSNTENIPFVTAILNNGYLGMVRQWQELFFDERYSGVYLDPERARLREARRGVRRGRPARRQPRGGRRRDREGLRDRGPQRGDRLPRRPARGRVPDGAGRRVERRHHPRARVRARTRPRGRHRSYERPPAHALGARRGPARRAHPRRGPVRRARVQHRLARGRRHRDARASRG